jgi:hypothetical protein
MKGSRRGANELSGIFSKNMTPPKNVSRDYGRGEYLKGNMFSNGSVEKFPHIYDNNNGANMVAKKPYYNLYYNGGRPGQYSKQSLGSVRDITNRGSLMVKEKAPPWNYNPIKSKYMVNRYSIGNQRQVGAGGVINDRSPSNNSNHRSGSGSTKTSARQLPGNYLKRMPPAQSPNLKYIGLGDRPGSNSYAQIQGLGTIPKGILKYKGNNPHDLSGNLYLNPRKLNINKSPFLIHKPAPSNPDVANPNPTNLGKPNNMPRSPNFYLRKDSTKDPHASNRRVQSSRDLNQNILDRHSARSGQYKGRQFGGISGNGKIAMTPARDQSPLPSLNS